MDSSLFLTTIATAIGLFTLFRKIRSKSSNQDNKENDSSSSSSSSSPSSVPPSSLSHIYTHHVFPSFRGEDVRRDFLSHIHMEFQRMGITPFIDNEIKRGESIDHELLRAIRESKIAVILISRNYASSKWCLDELVEIMKCRDELGQTVMAIFYRVDPSDVKKLTGDFGKVFRKTCVGKTKEVIGRWQHALAKVATIAGYHSSNWDNEATMIKKIATDISNKLNSSISSSDFYGLVGMRVHLENLKPLLCLDSDEVRMIGIWGPPGIGKTTIARVAYNQLSSSFQLSVFMENIKANYIRPSSDDYNEKLQLQQQFMSQITSHKDMEVSHLGIVKDRLKDKKVLVVLDGVDQLVQLDAMAKETLWFGPGSRIIITTQDQKLFKAHGVNHIYEVDLPEYDEAVQIFCMYAFGEKSPKNGFEELACKVTKLVGELPLGLRVMGSYFRGMSMEEWKKSLPRLETSLDTDIQSILKFSYDALDDEDKDLFLHISCFFNRNEFKNVEGLLAKKFVEVRQRLNVLAEKSLISFELDQYIKMHSLLEKLGREIVRKQSIHEPGQRQFLVDKREICEVLTGDASGGKNIIGINFDFDEVEIDISERAFEGMTSLQFLRVQGFYGSLQLPQGLNYLSSKLILLYWSRFPMTCLPFIVNLEFLVELTMKGSKLEKLWDGTKLLPNLKWMDLSNSKHLKELPDLSTTINLEKLDLTNCSNLVELTLSIGTFQKLERLDLEGCSKFEVLHTNVNLKSLEEPSLTYCSMLKTFPDFLEPRGPAIADLPPFLFHMSSRESPERLDCSFHNPKIFVNFAKCFKLNQETRDFIIQTPASYYAVLPGREVPLYFTHRATNEGSLKIEMNKRPLPSSIRFKVCISLVNKGDVEDWKGLPAFVRCKNNVRFLYPSLTEHLYIFEVDAEVTSSELVFEFKLDRNDLKIGECRKIQLVEVTSSELVFEFKIDNNDWKIGDCGLIQLAEDEHDESLRKTVSELFLFEKLEGAS